MVCLGLEPRAARWKVQTNPLSYGGTPHGKFFATNVLSKLAQIIVDFKAILKASLLK